MTKANNYRWKHGNSNIKASAHTKQSMYDAKEVVRLMVGYADSEVKKFHKPDVMRRKKIERELNKIWNTSQPRATEKTKILNLFFSFA